MPTTTLAETQVKAVLTNEQLQKARTQGLAPGDANPVTECMAAACAKVDTFAAGWLPSVGMRTLWARDLAAWDIAKRLGAPTEDQTKAKDRAEKELEDMRDGKFPGMPRDEDAVGSAGKVAHGSRPKVI